MVTMYNTEELQLHLVTVTDTKQSDLNLSTNRVLGYLLDLALTDVRFSQQCY
jgi:hypothetical protein